MESIERRLDSLSVSKYTHRGEHLWVERTFYGPGIWVNVPKGHYDTCSDEQCECRSYFWVKELNPFDTGFRAILGIKGDTSGNLKINGS